MARIGLTEYRYSPATVDASTGAVTYSGAKTPGKATSFQMTLNKADATLYANDAEAESDNSVIGGDGTIGIDRSDLTTMAELLGHTIDSGGEVIDNVNDTPPYVGFGRVVPIIQDGVKKYRATLLSLIKCSEPDENDTTRGQTVEFNTYEIPCKLTIPADGNWRYRKVFTTLADAVSYIEGLLAAPTP